jgi:hypothetical protein
MTKRTMRSASRLVRLGSARVQTNAVEQASKPEIDAPPLRFD